MSLNSASGLLFLRHAETDMAGTFCGHSDPPINSRGQVQITAMVARLGAETFDAIYTSNLRRAVETAEALAEHFAVPVTAIPGLREIYFGDWEGLCWAEIEQRDPVYARRWAEAFPALAAPGGESYGAFELRVLEAANGILSLAERKRIAVVTHGGVMRVVLRTMLGYSETGAWRLTKSYCSHIDLAGYVAALKVSS